LKKVLKNREANAQARPEIISAAEKLRNFLQYLDEEFASVEKKITLLTENNITYELLWFLFPIGCEVVFTEPQSGRHRSGKVSTIFTPI
jgi:hypothetical protein